MASDFHSTRVIARKREASDVVSFRLMSKEGTPPLPRFDAGSHIDVQLNGGIIRQYSLCNDPDEFGIYEFAVKLEPNSRGGSKQLHASLEVGDSLPISAPKNYFPLNANAKCNVLIGAGIGITPLLSMARSLSSTGNDYWLYYFARSVDAAGFSTALQNYPLVARTKLLTGLDAAATTRELEQIVSDHASSADMYYCGPTPFMNVVKSIALGRLPPERIHCEYFTPTPVHEDGDVSFELHLERTGLTLTIPSDKSITDVLLEHGIEINTSCEAGVCGACKTRVVGGSPLHRDTFLSVAEKASNNHVMPCVSRCNGNRLILDL